MSALFAPLKALSNTKIGVQEPGRRILYKCAPYNYFEVSLSWGKTLNDKQFKKIDNKPAVEIMMENFDYKENSNHLHAKQNDRWLKKFFLDELIKSYCNAKQTNTKFNINTAISNIQKNDFYSNKVSLSGKNPTEIDNSRSLVFKSLQNSFAESQVDIYFIDNNACVVGENNKPFKKAVDELNSITANISSIKIIVLDTTSATKEQLKEIFKVFDNQKNIPLLVTASSRAKHEQLGLDLIQGGTNKVYLSQSCESNKAVSFYEDFCKSLKDLTVSTEPGITRIIKRKINKSCKIVDPKIVQTNKVHGLDSANQNLKHNQSLLLNKFGIMQQEKNKQTDIDITTTMKV